MNNLYIQRNSNIQCINFDNVKTFYVSISENKLWLHISFSDGHSAGQYSINDILLCQPENQQMLDVIQRMCLACISVSGTLPLYPAWFTPKGL